MVVVVVVLSLKQICFIFYFSFTNVETKEKTTKAVLTYCVQT